MNPSIALDAPPPTEDAAGTNLKAMQPLTPFFSLAFLFVLSAQAGQLPARSRPLPSSQLQAQLLYSAALAGDWLVNNQEKRTLGNQPFNGDYGRWLYEYKLKEGTWRGSVCWTTGTGIMALSLLDQRFGSARYKEAMKRASRYLKSLQILDSRNPRTYGALREMDQLSDFLYPRDGATGALGGYLALYRVTGEKDYLERAELFADWFLKNAINPSTNWPYWSFPLDGTPADRSDRKMAPFQAGSGLFFYHLYKVTGKRVYFDKGVIPLAEGLLANAARENGITTFYSTGGLSQTKANNDDFASLTLLAAYRETGDKRYWDVAARRLDYLMGIQREDGSIVPGNPAGLYVSALTALDALQLAAEKGLAIDQERVATFVRRCAEYGATFQETRPHDIKAFGGFYGQINLQEFRREWVHARPTNYSIIFNLRYEGAVKVPYYSVFGWD